MRCLALFCLAAACDDALEPPTGEVVDYVVTRELMPATNSAAHDYGLDLNGDGTLDNQVGLVFSSLNARLFWPAVATERQIASGELVLRAQLQYPAALDEGIALRLTSGSLEAADTLLVEPSALPFDFGPGSLTVPISFYGQIIPLELTHARVQITTASSDRLEGVIDGGLRGSEVDTKLVLGFVTAVNDLVTAQCGGGIPPACGCANVSEYDAHYWLSLLNNRADDCTVTADEVRRNPIVVSLLAPDLMIDGEQLLSFGFGFEAAPPP